MLALPIFPGWPSIVAAVKKHASGMFQAEIGICTKKPHSFECGLCWRYLSSRAVTSQVLSAQMSLTSVFGMGTGGPSSQSTPTHVDGFKPIVYIKEAFHFQQERLYHRA